MAISLNLHINPVSKVMFSFIHQTRVWKVKTAWKVSEVSKQKESQDNSINQVSAEETEMCVTLRCVSPSPGGGHIISPKQEI